MSITRCPICNFSADFLASKQNRFNDRYDYWLCKNCRFLFDRDLALDTNKLQAKTNKVYQPDYFEKYDTGWKARGDGVVKVINVFLRIYQWTTGKKTVTVLDYGGGNGYVTSKIIPRAKIFYYDKYEKPVYFSNYTILKSPQKADVLYAVELVEHITDINEWNFLQQLRPDIFMFTTCLSDGIRQKELPGWDYLDPDAGHTALHSFRSLHLLARKYGFVYFFFPNRSCHIFWRSKLLSKVNFSAAEYFFYRILRKLVKG